MTQIQHGKLYIKKRPLPQWLAYFIFVMPFLLAFLQNIVGLDSFVKYTIDVAWILTFAILYLRRQVVQDRKFAPFLIFIGVFFAYTLIVYLFNFQSVFYYLWGFRNNFRFYIAFIIFVMMFTEEDTQFCLKFMDVLFWINAVVSLIQFFILGYQQDYLGGIFGVDRGCNSYSIVFFCIVIAKSVLMFMSRQENFFLCFAKCVTALIISAMAELKFFFVIFMIVMLLATVLTSFTWRKFLLIFVSALIVVFAGSLLTDIFGENNQLTFQRLWELATTESYATAEDLSRFTAIPTISNTILTDTPSQLFGMGLGNCDTSAFAICNTPFYQTHSDLHYTWFSSAFLFLETGYIGLALYILFFVMCIVFAFKMSKREGVNKLYCQMAMIMSVVCIILTFYNSSLRVEVAYMVYFVLALPFISAKSDTDIKRRFNLIGFH